MTTTSDAVEAAYPRPMQGLAEWLRYVAENRLVSKERSEQVLGWAVAIAALAPPQPGAILDAGGQESGHLAAPGRLGNASEESQPMPAEPTPEIINAMACCIPQDDEGQFPAVMDLLGFSGENKSRTILRAIYKAAYGATSGKEAPHD